MSAAPKGRPSATIARPNPIRIAFGLAAALAVWPAATTQGRVAVRTFPYVTADAYPVITASRIEAVLPAPPANPGPRRLRVTTISPNGSRRTLGQFAGLLAPSLRLPQFPPDPDYQRDVDATVAADASWTVVTRELYEADYTGEPTHYQTIDARIQVSRPIPEASATTLLHCRNSLWDHETLPAVIDGDNVAYPTSCRNHAFVIRNLRTGRARRLHVGRRAMDLQLNGKYLLIERGNPAWPEWPRAIDVYDWYSGRRVSHFAAARIDRFTLSDQGDVVLIWGKVPFDPYNQTAALCSEPLTTSVMRPGETPRSINDPCPGRTSVEFEPHGDLLLASRSPAETAPTTVGIYALRYAGGLPALVGLRSSTSKTWQNNPPAFAGPAYLWYYAGYGRAVRFVVQSLKDFIRRGPSAHSPTNYRGLRFARAPCGSRPAC
jgi:hypothetical protein